jgi:hypothetical protein
MITRRGAPHEEPQDETQDCAGYRRSLAVQRVGRSVRPSVWSAQAARVRSQGSVSEITGCLGWRESEGWWRLSRVTEGRVSWPGFAWGRRDCGGTGGAGYRRL